MKTLTLNLENCYGIRRLKTELSFEKSRSFAIYAPNGSMKSSLAKTFGDLSRGEKSTDLIFPQRPTSRTIVDDTNKEIDADSILVLQPYDEVFGHTEKTSTLLVNSKLRQEFEKLYVEIDKAKDAFLKALKKQSGSKKDLEIEISSAFTKSDKEFAKALNRVKDEVAEQKDAPFANVRYDVIFDERVQAFLDTKDFRIAIEQYIRRHDELIGASKYFQKGVFNYYNAATIAKSLADNGFFKAKHIVRLNGEAQKEISTEAELVELIQKEKDAITNDAELKKKFLEIEKQLEKNVTLRDFHAYILANQFVLSELANTGEFREKVWKSYFKIQSDLYFDLVERYQAAQKRQQEIEKAAEGERTQWEEVIEIFNDRFYVPFRLEARNRTAVILGQEALLNLEFVFKEGGDTAKVEKSDLLRALSTGERKALYVLNIIFEIQARLKAKQKTLIVVDDIADSFDYRNKYAIVEYLREISEFDEFRLLILTHNFDFFRTINLRFVGYGNSLMAVKSEKEVLLQKAEGVKNIFVNDWKKNFFTDRKKRIASIPFLRNVVEFTKGEQDPVYLKLTSLLHQKEDTDKYLESDLDALYSEVFDGNASWQDGKALVSKSIGEAAKECLAAADGLNFENKVVLAIAIRLQAERYMIQRIADDAFVKSIESNQTVRLFKKFKEMNSGEVAALNVLQRVLVMTPENIHLNSFMYEPIIDMSDAHFRNLYQDVLKL